MSLARQLVLLVSAMYLVVFAGTFSITVDNTRCYLVTQLESHAQDAATSLGLSLSAHLDDPLLMESMVDAVFDRGYYREIAVLDLDGKPVITRVLALQVRDVPDWFIRRVPLPTPVQSAQVMAGWRQGGTVRVRSHPGHAYAGLWANARGTLGWSLATLALAIAVTTLALRAALRPLRDVEAQALAVANREFPRVDRVPRARELRRVVVAMNGMVTRVEAMLAEQYERAERLRESAYRDPTTGLGHQHAFERDLERLVSDEEAHAFGAVVFARVLGLEAVNRESGCEAGDRLLAAAGEALRAVLEHHEASTARLTGSLFAAVLPGLARSEIETLARAIIDALAATDVEGAAPPGVAYYVGGQPVPVLLERAQGALRNAEESGPGAWHVWDATETAAGRDVHHEDRWREILERVIAERSIVLVVQPVMAVSLDAEVHREVLARIRPAGGGLVAAGLFFPMAARVGLAVALDRLIVQAAIERVGTGAGPRYALNLSRQSVCDDAFVSWLVLSLAASADLGTRLAFEVTEQVAARAPVQVVALAGRVRAAGAQFGVDHCGARDLALDYMKRLKADYSKVAADLVRPSDLAGYRNAPVYIRRSMHVPPGPVGSAPRCRRCSSCCATRRRRRSVSCSGTSCSSTSTRTPTATGAWGAS